MVVPQDSRGPQPQPLVAGGPVKRGAVSLTGGTKGGWIHVAFKFSSILFLVKVPGLGSGSVRVRVCVCFAP